MIYNPCNPAHIARMIKTTISNPNTAHVPAMAMATIDHPDHAIGVSARKNDPHARKSVTTVIDCQKLMSLTMIHLCDGRATYEFWFAGIVQVPETGDEKQDCDENWQHEHNSLLWGRVHLTCRHTLICGEW
jgi:hypothetical protein